MSFATLTNIFIIHVLINHFNPLCCNENVKLHPTVWSNCGPTPILIRLMINNFEYVKKSVFVIPVFFRFVGQISAFGYYLYIESGSPRHPGDKARLYSELYPAVNRTQCFSFWYHMWGSSVGSLNVYVLHNTTLFNEEKLWSLSGNQNNTWRHGLLNISTNYTSQPFQASLCFWVKTLFEMKFCCRKFVYVCVIYHRNILTVWSILM